MDVFDRAEAGRVAGDAARDNDRNFALKRNKPFKDGFGVLHFSPGIGKIGIVGDFDLTFAVIAHFGGFQNRRTAKFGNGGLKIGEGSDGFKRGGADAMIIAEGLFAQAVLRKMQAFPARTYRDQIRQQFDAIMRDIFKFKCHHIDVFGKGAQSVQIAVIGNGCLCTDLFGRAICAGAKDMNLIAEFCGTECRHAAQLAIAHNADGAARCDNARFEVLRHVFLE